MAKKGYYVVGFVFVFFLLKPFNVPLPKEQRLSAIFVLAHYFFFFFFYLLNKGNFILMPRKKEQTLYDASSSHTIFRTTLLNKASEVHNLFDGSFQTNQLKLNFSRFHFLLIQIKWKRLPAALRLLNVYERLGALIFIHWSTASLKSASRRLQTVLSLSHLF